MATRTESPRQPPSPAQAEAVSPWTLAFALLGAPVAWAVQLSLCYALAAHACFPRAMPLAAPLWQSLPAVVGGISVAAFLVSAAACWVGWQGWRRVRELPPDPRSHHWLGPGAGHLSELLEWGFHTGLMFLVVLLFSSVNLPLVPLCSP